MPKFMICGTYTPEGLRGLQKDMGSGGERAVAAACEALSGRLDAIYWALGKDDVFAIVELPSHVHAATLGAAIGAS